MRFSQHAGMNLAYRRVPLELFLDTQRRLEVSHIEFWAGFPHFPAGCADRSAIRTVKTKIADYGLRTIAVTMPSLGYQYQYCPADKDMAARCYAYFCSGLELAGELGASIMTVNSGWSYYDKPASDGFAYAGDFLAQLCKRAAEMGVTLALESLTPLESNLAITMDSTQRLLDAVGDERLRLTIDTGACACSGENSRDWLKRFQGRVAHVHFVDGTKGAVGHLVWGEGAVDLKSELSAYDEYGYAGYLSSELSAARYGLAPHVADARNVQALRNGMNG